ncbi:hypothetical protein L2E82_35635 [Cichorium intybus]|uniref:Uncharacterized protein n=1 Tax=Cichorium intybus TaxID=13427 RepID=A0ACB9BPB7_CICIN|nr:hypothetical protein L2E82_35635 [Cichorium intybus]
MSHLPFSSTFTSPYHQIRFQKNVFMAFIIHIIRIFSFTSVLDTTGSDTIIPASLCSVKLHSDLQSFTPIGGKTLVYCGFLSRPPYSCLRLAQICCSL